MTVTVRHVLFVLSLTLCCACGCMAGVPQNGMSGISANELSVSQGASISEAGVAPHGIDEAQSIAKNASAAAVAASTKANNSLKIIQEAVDSAKAAKEAKEQNGVTSGDAATAAENACTEPEAVLSMVSNATLNTTAKLIAVEALTAQVMEMKKEFKPVGSQTAVEQADKATVKAFVYALEAEWKAEDAERYAGVAEEYAKKSCKAAFAPVEAQRPPEPPKQEANIQVQQDEAEREKLKLQQSLQAQQEHLNTQSKENSQLEVPSEPSESPQEMGQSDNGPVAAEENPKSEEQHATDDAKGQETVSSAQQQAEPSAAAPPPVSAQLNSSAATTLTADSSNIRTWACAPLHLLLLAALASIAVW
ncbi:hypothetical protein DQ04_10581020 [Trypanosoma grayi]|uniref:hypothetical protein n=1 Tax=Trypanosoma grayi TaxID=71804 RepID=UPI0004F3F1CC|nr:hypothetical protein DQ04_10581020 [Trypanosoma grayi]KEG07199.1 hypothetical protein DQ04_10581020 [Trypanosoma grayi]